MELEGKRVLVTTAGEAAGFALSVAALARELGAEVLVAGPEGLPGMERDGEPLPAPGDVLALDPREREADAALRAEIGQRWGRVDGALHAIGPTSLGDPADGGPEGEMRRAERAFLTSAYSLSALARAVLPVIRTAPRPGSIVALSLDPGLAGGAPGWIGGTETALEAVNRYLACDLGPRGVRVNLVAVRSNPGGDTVARVACFLLSDWARAITGEVVHVDGGAGPI